MFQSLAGVASPFGLPNQGNDQFTKILMHMDQQFGQIPPTGEFVDDALGLAAAGVWINQGAAVLDVANSKFGGGSLLLDGTATSYISTPHQTDYNPGDGPFTFDCWLRSTAPTVLGAIFGQGPGTGSWLSSQTATGAVEVNFVEDGPTGRILTSTSTLTDGLWHHVAFVVEGPPSALSDAVLYFDGVEEARLTFTTNIRARSEVWNYGLVRNIATPFSGNIEEGRYSIGIARWLSNFTPPTSSYKPEFRNPERVGGNDQFTRSLLHMEGAEGSTVFNDDAVGGTPTPKTWVVVAPAQITNVNPKFEGSYLGDGQSSGIHTFDANDLRFFGNQVTVDCWVYPTAFVVFQTIWGQLNATGGQRGSRLMTDGAGNPFFEISIVGDLQSFTSDIPLTLNTWSHVAITHDPAPAGTNGFGELRMWVDGVEPSTSPYAITTGEPRDTGAPVGVGMLGSFLTDVEFDGQIEEFRYSQGVLRWTDAFTPPARIYSVGKGGNGNDQFTKILLHMDGAESSTVFEDNAAGLTPQGIWTPVAPALITNVNPKFDGGFSGDGTNTQISTPYNEAYDFALFRDMSVDCWLYPFEQVPSNRFWAGHGGAIRQFRWYIAAANNRAILEWGLDDGGQLAFNASTADLFTLNSWQHIAFTLDYSASAFGTMRMWVGGNETEPPQVFPSLIQTNQGSIIVGNAATGNTYNGKVDEFRISQGILRWTKDFTPPTAPYST